MKQVVKSEKLPIKLWLENVESGTMEQARNLANLPFAFKHIALMPDAHLGYGMPIGGVLATEGQVIPNAVGVDIGCGMCAMRTSLTHLEKPGISAVLARVRERIPLGFKHHKKPRDKSLMPGADMELPVINKEYSNALSQLGTLGGGNHFIEFQRGDDNRIWVMVHSGSRNIGFQVANHYNRLASEKNLKDVSPIPPSWQLSHLDTGSRDGRLYLNEMNFCVDFALANRRLMMQRIKDIMADTFMNIDFDEMINIAHNYASMEKHFGKKVIVHRKGATQARKGQTGIIPGSQGAESYIVRGKGNPESFESCAHGAGRLMGRKEARRKLGLESEIKGLEKMGVIHSIRSKRDLDEAPGAYKNITEVMKNQEDLVEIIVKLRPIAVIKG
jgi:tRNA-splicing ligase RtcB